jgi:exopolyphosphatase/guanosine-5'-triphosphate,3'-diphosphate pyrophosphatase
VKLDILAAIDVGSNAVRLLIDYVEIEDAAYALKKLAYLRVPIRLGEDVFTRCRVGQLKIRRLLEAMQGFRHVMRAYGVSEVRACATSAMREAENGEELVAAVREKSGIGIEIISSREEADLIYAAGSRKRAAIDTGTAMHVDVGGGSTEIVLYQDGKLHFRDSFRIGTVRMLSSAGRSDAADELERERFALSLGNIHAAYAPERVIASGGNINKIHKILGKPAGVPVKPDELGNLLAKLKPLSIVERMREFGLNDYRADVIVPALEIFLRIARECPGIRAIHIPKIGLADGLMHDLCKKRLAAGTYHQEKPHG